MVRFTDRERLTLEQEVEEEVKREQAAERRAAKRAAKSVSPTAGDVPDVGVSQPIPPPDLPEKKPASGVSHEAFWHVVGEMARQNAKETAAEARRLLEAAEHADEQEKRHKTGSD
jgi:hypothetical protein